MRDSYLLSGQVVIGKMVSVLSFPISGVDVVIMILRERGIVFQSRTLRHESNVHPLHISYDP